MIYHYADVLADGRVRACFTYDGPDEGPPEPHWESQAEGQVVLLDAPIDWRGPTETSVLHWIDGAAAWIETATLDDLKARKNAEINQWRAAANQSTFPHAGKQISCDALSRSDIDAVANHVGLFGAFPEGFPMAWKATDNTFIPLADIAAFKAMYASMTAQGTSNFEHSQALKGKLENATTVAAVAAISWQSIDPT